MTALIYALSRFYNAYVEARLQQAKAEIRRHTFTQ